MQLMSLTEICSITESWKYNSTTDGTHKKVLNLGGTKAQHMEPITGPDHVTEVSRSQSGEPLMHNQCFWSVDSLKVDSALSAENLW